MTFTGSTHRPAPAGRGPWALSRVAAGVDFYPEGRDAAALGAELADALSADLIFVAVHPDPLVVMPGAMNWSGLHKQSETMLRELRDELAPAARLSVETDFSVPRALERLVRREHRDLLVVGSSRHGKEGRVRIGKRTRQLLNEAGCVVAVAPRGWHLVSGRGVERIGVGYDGSQEAETALQCARSIAQATGAKLHVRGVVDDRLPPIAYTGFARVPDFDLEGVVETGVEELRERTVGAARAADPSAEADVMRGRPADRLAALDVDLLVLGSRRWGPVARLGLGSTAEALLQDVARCPVLVVPRPQA
jgi:nucleotide-binding universal stress UspA family protein